MIETATLELSKLILFEALHEKIVQFLRAGEATPQRNGGKPGANLVRENIGPRGLSRRQRPRERPRERHEGV